MVEYFGAFFQKHKYSAIDGRTTVVFQEQPLSVVADPYRIVITQGGISFKGNLTKEITNAKELEDYARLLADAWKEHCALAPKLVTSLSGH